jgi:tight adherence protein E
MKLIKHTIRRQLPIRLIHNESGVVALEMTLILIPFILLFLFVAELCSVLYVSSSIDLAMAEGMRFTSSLSAPSMSAYKTAFSKKMEERIKILPLMVYNADNINFDVTYCHNLGDVAAGQCHQPNASLPSVDAEGKNIPDSGTPIAYYSIFYRYKPIFLPIPTKILHQTMSRNGVYVMEYTRVRKLS